MPEEQRRNNFDDFKFYADLEHFKANAREISHTADYAMQEQRRRDKRWFTYGMVTGLLTAIAALVVAVIEDKPCTEE